MRRIYETYLRTRKASDLFTNTYVFRPLSAPLVLLCAATPVTPNQVTLASFVVAVGAAGLLVGWLGYLGLVVGTGLFTFAYLLDCVDGMLARYKGVASPAGHHFDFLMDEIKSFVLLGAVATRLYRESMDSTYLLLGIGGLVCLATGIAITTFERRPEVTPPRSESSPAPPTLVRRAVGLGVGALKYVVHYPSYLLVVGLSGRIELYFYPYVAVMALYTLRSLLWLTIRFGIR
ncbi:MAG: CDP-alcohol phosphatidyltransferase family protein [Polyangiaceae bacterium]|nr:CDP-alcohol phosphatidyltransferase family protein [Polyangiaceae bacterium]